MMKTVPSDSSIETLSDARRVEQWVREAIAALDRQMQANSKSEQHKVWMQRVACELLAYAANGGLIQAQTSPIVRFQIFDNCAVTALHECPPVELPTKGI